MSEPAGAERRKSDRVDAALHINLHIDLDGYETSESDLEALNVSSSGVYFRSDTYIEPMTKLALNFDVPLGDDKFGRVDCEGIVARVIPEIPDPEIDQYEVAVFFTTIDADSLHNLEKYVAQRISV